MGARKVTELLDSAETDLNGVTRSMLMADPLLLQESQAVLEQLVESLRRMRAAAGTSAHVWPQGTRVRLQTVHAKLRRLEILGDAAIAAVDLRSERSALATGGYTIRGAECLRPEASTVKFDC